VLPLRPAASDGQRSAKRARSQRPAPHPSIPATVCRWRAPLLLETETVLPWPSRREMPHRARPMTGMLVFLDVNLVLVNTISPVYDFVCFHPYWERRVLHSLSSSAFPSQNLVL
jgi:hypothetical protein